MIAYGKILTYPLSTRLIDYSCVVGGVGFVVVSGYGVLIEALATRVLWGVGICFGVALFFGGVVELFNHQMILLDDQGVHTKGPNRWVSISWDTVDEILCVSTGYASSPFISYYVVSYRAKEIVQFSQEIDYFDDLCSMLFDRLRSSEIKYAGFLELVKVYRKVYSGA